MSRFATSQQTGALRRSASAFEAGIATRYHLVHRPLSAMKMTGMGLALVKRRRVALKPKKIRRLHELGAIVEKAREISGRSS